MEYWIIVDRRHAGPYSARQLIDAGLKDDTLVWCEGLTAWTPAGQIEELASMMRMRDARYTSAAPAPQEQQEHAYASAAAPQPQPCAPREQYPQYDTQPQQAAVPAEPCPPAYIAWSVIATLLCCTIAGIPAIIFSSMTKSAYYKGDLEKAKKYSERAQWWIILSITLGAVTWPFQMAFMGI